MEEGMAGFVIGAILATVITSFTFMVNTVTEKSAIAHGCAYYSVDTYMFTWRDNNETTK